MQSLSDFFKDNKKININVDNDGVFSSAVLAKYYDCVVSGFNNNDKIIIHEKNVPYEDLIYVDLHVGYPSIKSIDQHMVSIDEEHNELIKNNPNKINPNVEYDVVWSDYVNKFPFSTTIFLLVKAEADGKDLSDIDLNKLVTPKIRLGDLIWQTDSSYENYFKYTRNVNNWLERILLMSNNGEFTTRLVDWLRNEIPSDYHERDILSMQIGLWYKESFKCNNNHGGIKDGFITEEGKISDNLYRYLQIVSSLFGTSMGEIRNKEFETVIFKSKRFSYSTVKEKFDSTKLFSYGFIWGMSKDKNISATYQ